VLAAQGRAAEALRAFDDAAAACAAMGSRLDLARICFHRGALHAAQGEPAAARADWEQALALFTACGALPEAAKTQAALAA
jgi:Tetratricopeptide repeat